MILENDEEGRQPVLQVISVRRDNNDAILHHGRLVEMVNHPLRVVKVGAIVEQILDGEQRELHSRLHTGGHLLGLAVRQLSSLISDAQEVKAQHYPGISFVQYQGIMEEKHMASIQAELDKLVARDLPVLVSWLGSAELEMHTIYVPNGFDRSSPQGTRVVEIGCLGGYPCGGTHVSTTSELRKVTITKITSKKRVTKVYYEIE